MNDDLSTVRKWRIGELSTGLRSSEEILELAQSFVHTESFLDTVEDLLKTVDDVFELRPVSEEGLLSFLERPTQGNKALLTNRLEALYLAWQLASDLNPAVASFQGDTLRKLKAEIHLVNRDAMNAARDGGPLQKVKAATNSRRDITDAFYRVNRELGIHRAKCELARRVCPEKSDSQIPAAVAEDPPPPLVAPDKPNSPKVQDLKSKAGKPEPDGTVSGPSEQDNPPIQWSNYRQPKEWRRLRKLKGLSNSVNIWRNLCRDNPDDIQRESTQNARISLKLAQSWGLDLPEFRT